MSEVIDTIPQSKLRNPLFNAIWSLDSSGNPVGLVGPEGGRVGFAYASTVADDQNAAAANFEALASILGSGGHVVVGNSLGGDIYVDRTLPIASNTRLEVLGGTRIKLADGANCQLLRNVNAQNTVAAANFTHAAGVCTVMEKGHNRQVGDRVYIEGLASDAVLLGVQTITASTSGSTWAFSATGSGTPTGYGYIAPYVPLDGSSFKRGATASATCTISGGTTLTITGSLAGVFVEGMTVTGTGIPASTVIHGPSGATLEGVGTTWSLSATCTNGTGVAVSGATPASLVQVSESDHRKEIGNPVYISGLSGTDSFNGAVEVVAATTNYWYYVTIGTTAETATGIANVLHDNNISISGEFDGNYRNQQPSYTNSFGVVLGNVGKYSIKDSKGIGFYKYAFWLFNTTDCDIDTVGFDTRSDGVHFEAPWNRISIQNLSGKNDDDVLSFTNNALTSTWPALCSPSGQGSGDNVLVNGIFPSFSANSSVIKISGDFDTAGHTVGKFKISGIFGKAAFGVFINTGVVGNGTRGETIDIDGVSLEGVNGVAIPIKFNCGTTGGFDAVSIRNVPLTGNNGYAQFYQSGTFGVISIEQKEVTTQNVSPYVEIAEITVGKVKLNFEAFTIHNNSSSKAINLNAATIGELEVSGKFTGTSNNGYGIYQGNGTTLSRLCVRNCTKTAMNQFFAQQSGVTAAIKIHVNDFVDNSGGSDFVTYSDTNMLVSNVDASGTGAYFLAPQSTATCRLAAGLNCKFSNGTAIRNASGTVNSASGFGIKLDIGASGATTPTGMTPLAGDIVWNTNATGTGLYGRTAGGAWAKIF